MAHEDETFTSLPSATRTALLRQNSDNEVILRVAMIFNHSSRGTEQVCRCLLRHFVVILL